MKEIILKQHEIAKLIEEKYKKETFKNIDVVVSVESKIQNYHSKEAKRVYYPEAHIWIYDDNDFGENTSKI